MDKLQSGMTVQYDSPFWRVAYCVRCGWRSQRMKYANARRLAAQPNSHDCPRAEAA